MSAWLHPHHPHKKPALRHTAKVIGVFLLCAAGMFVTWHLAAAVTHYVIHGAPVNYHALEVQYD